MREVLLVLHIAAAGIWFGANVLQAVAPRMLAEEGSAPTAAWYRAASRLGRSLYGPTVLVLLVTGVFLVLQTDAYGFGSLFVTIGFAMIVIGVVLGSLVFDPGASRAAEAIDAQDAAGVKSAVARLATFGSIETVLLLLTIAAMVTRWD